MQPGSCTKKAVQNTLNYAKRPVSCTVSAKKTAKQGDPETLASRLYTVYPVSIHHTLATHVYVHSKVRIHQYGIDTVQSAPLQYGCRAMQVSKYTQQHMLMAIACKQQRARDASVAAVFLHQVNVLKPNWFTAMWPCPQLMVSMAVAMSNTSRHTYLLPA